MIWLIVYLLTALPVCCLMVYALLAYSERMTFIERGVIGMIAATMLLRLGPIIGKNIMRDTSPFDDWSISLLNVCLLLGAVCVIRRIETAIRRGL